VKRLGLHYRHFGTPLPLLKRLRGRFTPKNSAFWRRVEKVGLAAKTLVDQFLYTPFLSNPMQTLAFLWKSEQFSFRRTVEKMRQFRQFYVLTVLPVLVSNWLFWIPMVVLIYCFPTSLQLPLGILACAIWSMLLTALVTPADARVTSTKDLSGKLSVSDSAEPWRE
jgi:hypothetical protein